MLENYILLGNRVDDPDKYDNLLMLITDLLGKLNIVQERGKKTKDKKSKVDENDNDLEKKTEIESLKIDGWIRQVETVGLLMDYFQTRPCRDRGKEK
jgi:hypothetical protein